MGFNLFTWWQGMTFGTWAATVFGGEEVGRDGDGNIYYQSKKGAAESRRRWVIYKASNDASRVPPEWHIWLHHTRETLPTESPLPVKAWEKPWRPNPTGSATAERPQGSLARGGQRAASSADYRSWAPD